MTLGMGKKTRPDFVVMIWPETLVFSHTPIDAQNLPKTEDFDGNAEGGFWPGGEEASRRTVRPGLHPRPADLADAACRHEGLRTEAGLGSRPRGAGCRIGSGAPPETGRAARRGKAADH